MNDLLASAVAAHGGVDRWNRIHTIAVDGIVIPATRRAYAPMGDDQIVFVAIDMADIAVH